MIVSHTSLRQYATVSLSYVIPFMGLAPASTSQALAEDVDIALFADDSFDLWMSAGGEPIRPGWQLEEEVLHLDSSLGRAGHLLTKQEFGQFELKFEWRIASGGNSGVKYRVKRYGNRWLGCEYQLIDDDGYRSFVPRQKKTASLYDLYAPRSDKAVNRPGEWNASRIVVGEDCLEHWLNGQLVVEAEVGGAMWDRRVAASKFAEYHDFGTNHSGRIMITDHGSDVWYRNVILRISRVPPD